jgi:hypothetical protein
MENEEDSQSDEGSKVGGQYDYLLKMTFWMLTKEKKDELLQKRDGKLTELKILQGRSPSSLWKEDLDNFLEEVSFDKMQLSVKGFVLCIFISRLSLVISYCYLHLGITCVTVTCIWNSGLLQLSACGNQSCCYSLHLGISSVIITCMWESVVLLLPAYMEVTCY